MEVLGTRTFIDERPEVITNRERIGDLEADFIVSGKSGSGYLLTAVDRRIRYGFIRKILPVTIGNVEAALLHVQQAFPELASLTLDNDLLFRYHERLEACWACRSTSAIRMLRGRIRCALPVLPIP